MSSAVSALRELLDRQFPDATPVPRRGWDVGVVATGVPGVDAIFPHGGLPKGRLSMWAPAGGATAMMRSTVNATVAQGERVAWIDGRGTIAGACWTAGPVLIRPAGRVQTLRAAEELVRSGGFALVVMTGVELEGTEPVRLSRAAHEGGGALVVLGSGSAMSGLTVRSSIAPGSYVWRRGPLGELAAVDAVTVEVRATALGWSRRTRVRLPVWRDALRIALEPTLPDRRGVR